MTYGKQIQARRKQLHLTQQQLADSVGKSKSFIKQVEGDVKAPSLAALELFVTALGGRVAIVWESHP